jgi:hypothetical protein
MYGSGEWWDNQIRLGNRIYSQTEFSQDDWVNCQASRWKRRTSMERARFLAEYEEVELSQWDWWRGIHRPLPEKKLANSNKRGDQQPHGEFMQCPFVCCLVHLTLDRKCS